jgi:hypothetical protein
VAILLGLIALVVPGLMIATAWLVSMPSLVVERVGIRAAINRSIWLTSGYRWPVFGFLAVFLVISIIVSGAGESWDGPFVGLPLFDQVSAVVRALVEDMFEIAAALIFTLTVSSVYFELRLIKEAVLPEDLARGLD